jgi:UDP-N-acetyl-D-galactosamine dehydrogenase
MNLFGKLKNKETKISVIGLGYVGLPVAVTLAEKFDVVGFDINNEKVEIYNLGIDPTNEVGDEAVKNTTAIFTSDENMIRDAMFHVIAVPTPITTNKVPNLEPVLSASKTVGRHMQKGSIVVYESTVYPGVTEEICVPLLEESSGLKYGEDFKVGYSPERVNPGDKEHTFSKIIKVVSGMDEESLEVISNVYNEVVTAGVYEAESIRVAEAAKVIENAQRDINIAFMNELSMIFNMMDIDTKAVLRAAKTKWNFLNFEPGLVGGHCIGVDPYYITYKAKLLGYHSQIILAGRKINDNMGKFVVQNIIKQLVKSDIAVKSAKVAILGFTFKENCPDTRNTKVIDIVTELGEYGITPLIYDPIADEIEAYDEYGIEFVNEKELCDLDALILAVKHDEFLNMSTERLESMFKQSPNKNKVMIDVKGVLERDVFERLGYNYFRL